MARTVRLSWARAAGALPALALIGTGTVLAATGGAEATGVVADGAPRVVVPQQPVTRQAAPLLPPLPALPTDLEPAPETPTPAQAPATLAGALTSTGIPAPALAAYRRAAQLVGVADPGCRLDWPLVAAIGKVESDHGRWAGNGLDGSGTVRPGIFGIPLDGSDATAVIRDTDHGVYDRDQVWDRAVGPMQFIPSTWRVVGVDADGDGVRNPQNLTDAATATAVYLCSGPGDLTDPADLTAAVRRYNDSDAYVREVVAIADGYRRGVTVLPAQPLTGAQLTGAPYLPSGEPGVMQTYAGRPAAGASGGAPASTRTKPGHGPSTGVPRGPQAPTGEESRGDRTPAPASPTPSPTSTGGALDGAVKPVETLTELTKPLTGGGSTPTPTTSTVGAPTGTGTAAPTTRCVVDLLGVRVCTTS